MLPPFEISVPADPRFRPLAPLAAGKYAELAGCAAEEAQSVRARVDAAITQLADAASDINVVCEAGTGAVTVTLSAGGRSATVRQPQAAR